MFEKLQIGEKIHDAPRQYSLEPAAILFMLERSQESARRSWYLAIILPHKNTWLN